MLVIRYNFGKILKFSHMVTGGIPGVFEETKTETILKTNCYQNAASHEI